MDMRYASTFGRVASIIYTSTLYAATAVTIHTFSPRNCGPMLQFTWSLAEFSIDTDAEYRCHDE